VNGKITAQRSAQFTGLRSAPLRHVWFASLRFPLTLLCSDFCRTENCTPMEMMDKTTYTSIRNRWVVIGGQLVPRIFLLSRKKTSNISLWDVDWLAAIGKNIVERSNVQRQRTGDKHINHMHKSPNMQKTRKKNN